MEPVHITTHSVTVDEIQGDAIQSEVTKRVDGDITSIRMTLPGGMVPAVDVVSRNPDVAHHELRQYVALRNLQAQARLIPEARRRREERKQRLREQRSRERCTGCGGSGWVEDHEHNQQPCPSCSG